MEWIVYILGTVVLWFLGRFVIRDWPNGFRKFGVLALWGVSYGMAAGITRTWGERPFGSSLAIGMILAGLAVFSVAVYVIIGYEREKDAAFQRQKREHKGVSKG